MIFGPEIEPFLRDQAKAALRKRMRALRNSIPEKARAVRSQKIVDSILASRAFAQATAIAMFAPMLDRNEVDVRPLDQAARAAGKLVAYPLCESATEMTLRCADPATFEERGYGFAEPPIDSPEVPVSAGLLVVVPALAVDPTGHRVGYGKGFYDRLLARVAPPAVSLAVAYDFQVVMEIPKGEHDRPVNIVITDVRSWGEV